jgi:type IV secretion system protein VirB4
MAAGGKYYEPGKGGVFFQPLGILETTADIIWATEFIETLLTIQNLVVTPPISTAISEAVTLLQSLPRERRTLTSFCQICNYLDPESKKNPIRDYLRPYCLGGKYGEIFDQAATGISLDKRWLTIELEYLMNMGEACVAPALLYLFHYIESTFSGRLTLLVLDEAWRLLRHPLFAARIEEWLKTLRKKHVFVVFATQDIGDALKSPLCSTLIQQCPTKIFLADPMAGEMADAYGKFGLSGSEIDALAHARMKKDYLYTSPLGTRLFQLDLGPVTLALLGSPDHELLDTLETSHGTENGYEYAFAILSAKGVAYKHFLPV